MDWQELRLKMELAIGQKVTIEKVNENKFMMFAETKHVLIDEEYYFFLTHEQEELMTLNIHKHPLSQAECDLIQLLIDTVHQTNEIPSKDITERQNAQSISSFFQQWITQQLRSENPDLIIPETFKEWKVLYESHIPLYIENQHKETSPIKEDEMHKILHIFFEQPVLLIPLSTQQWLVLASEQIIDSDGIDIEQEENDPLGDTTEQRCEALTLGLYDMFRNEGIGEFHLAVHLPIVPNKNLIPTIHLLQETIRIGKVYYPNASCHFTWKLHVEKLLYRIAEADKSTYMTQVLSINEKDLDEEIIMTVEAFLNTSCHITQTAKKLFIHRNTLIYRLEKFKQISGWDVRDFQHAVLVKLAILLYKLTKKI